MAEDVVQEIAVAEEARVPRREQIPVRGRRERHPGGEVETERAVQVRHHDGAVVARQPHHLAREQALVPDVGERVREDDHRERTVAERQRVVGVAADGRAPWRGEALRQPQLPEVHVGDDHRLAALLGEHARQMAGAAAQVDHPGRAFTTASEHAHQRFGQHERRVGETVDEVGALRVGADDLERLAIRRGAASEQRVQPLRPRGVETEQSGQRFGAASSLHRVHRGAGGLVGDEHRNPVDDGERAALAPEDAPANLLALAHHRLVVHEIQHRAAEGAPQQLEQGCVHQAVSNVEPVSRSMNAGAVEPTSARR